MATAMSPMAMDFMYGRGFHDPAGHLWEMSGWIPARPRANDRRIAVG
jgi:predicted lactoylglutathione lyase